MIAVAMALLFLSSRRAARGFVGQYSPQVSLSKSSGLVIPALSSASASSSAEYLLSPANLSADVAKSVELLSSLRPGLNVVVAHPAVAQTQQSLTWSLHAPGSNLQLDCTSVDEMYLGRAKLDQIETANKWNDIISHRRRHLFPFPAVSSSSSSSVSSSSVNLGDGGMYQRELNVAMAAVHRASFVSRSLQKKFLSIAKGDNSPVTIADFAVQALVIDALMRAFPDDRFIAEEDSSILKEDTAIRQGVLDALQAASMERWTDQRLFTTIDAGAFAGSAARVWVLDPVDGTKGFIRGEHYCIALALLVDGRPELSVMGCPNVNLKNVLQPALTATGTPNIAEIDQSFTVKSTTTGPTLQSTEATLFPASSGSVFYSVTGRGAWARSLSMPLGAGYEVQVSAVDETRNAALCESSEASHGDRAVTKAVFAGLGLTRDYVRLDGQCKYCVVGSGAAEGNMRLPPAGYTEKIWDHAPGVHFITEAGGKVTDLEGRALDFSTGRHLARHVTGILAANNKLHAKILEAIVRAKAANAATTSTQRVFGAD